MATKEDEQSRKDVHSTGSVVVLTLPDAISFDGTIGGDGVGFEGVTRGG